VWVREILEVGKTGKSGYILKNPLISLLEVGNVVERKKDLKNYSGMGI
jgi:hypothetical protein